MTGVQRDITIGNCRLILGDMRDVLPALELRATLECGLRRAMALHPGLEGKIVHAGKGIDLNDVLMGETPEDEGGDS